MYFVRIKEEDIRLVILGMGETEWGERGEDFSLIHTAEIFSSMDKTRFSVSIRIASCMAACVDKENQFN